MQLLPVACEHNKVGSNRPNESGGIIEKALAELSKLHAKCSTTFYWGWAFMRNVEVALGPL